MVWKDTIFKYLMTQKVMAHLNFQSKKKKKLKWMTATTNCVYADDSDPFIKVSINAVIFGSSILVIVVS